MKKPYWYATRRWYDSSTGKLVTYGYDIYKETKAGKGRSTRWRRIVKNATDISRAKIRKIVKVLNGEI
jgi:hypothetical protein